MDFYWAYLNGRWLPDRELSIAVDDFGFTMGATVTERLRTFAGRVYRLEEHLERLRQSLDIVGLDSLSLSRETADAIADFLVRNCTRIASDDDWSILAFITPGRPALNRPTICVHGFPLQFQNWSALYDSGVAVAISDVRQIPPGSLPPSLKCRSRMHYYLADRHAAATFKDARAVLLDGSGNVAEATTANVLIYHADRGLITPPSEHVLFGVSLTAVQAIATRLDIPFSTQTFGPDELCQAQEAMLASTSVCLLPITECDGKPIGDGKPGPVFQKLLSAWGEAVGVDIAEQARRCGARRVPHAS